MRNTEEFYRFYKAKMNALKYEPNITHFKLAELENKSKLTAVITQNIDGLHQKAGSKINYFRGKNIVLINRDATAYDNMADLVINDSLGKVFEAI